MPDINNKAAEKTLYKKIISGFFSITFLRFFNMVISFIIAAYISRILDVSDFGIYYIVISNYILLSMFLDWGISTALIRKEKISPFELKNAFSFNLINSFIIFFLSLCLSPLFALYYSEPEINAAFSFYSILFILNTFKIVPLIVIKRNIDFVKLSLVNGISKINYNIFILIFVFSGYGYWSFIFASIIENISQIILLLILEPFRLGLKYNAPILKDLLNFGIPFNLEVMVGIISGYATPVIIGFFFGIEELGYLDFASRSLFVIPYSFSLIMSQILYPTFSRLSRENNKFLKKVVENTINSSAYFLYPISLGMIIYINQIIMYLFDPKFLPAAPAFVLSAITLFFTPISLASRDLFYVMGNTKLNLRLRIFWTCVIWIFGFLFIPIFGFLSILVANLINLLSYVIIIPKMKKYLDINFKKILIKPILSNILFLISLLLLRSFISDLFTLILICGINVLIYIGILLIIDRELIKTFFKAKDIILKK